MTSFPMPLFYFDIHDRHGDRCDETGRELPDAEAAHRVAIDRARELLAAEIRGGEIHLSCYIEILDETRIPVLRVTFEEAVTITF
ncbi:hypothetical protein E2493_03465 [Sphingomonas parva]|uniref:DUF6894 domain-containing protein n=1 Tax=Sphingomonas parva TaxID=2555898 RepID=A0A4Y8ZUU4_9SPHN|nr:hypothetical protein [Sphingomonas parva]TFI59684.1 hypothetical protein E2493_03465 [Sphingomonas parva]